MTRSYPIAATLTTILSMLAADRAAAALLLKQSRDAAPNTGASFADRIAATCEG